MLPYFSFRSLQQLPYSNWHALDFHADAECYNLGRKGKLIVSLAGIWERKLNQLLELFLSHQFSSTAEPKAGCEEEGRQINNGLLKICCWDMKVLILYAGRLSPASMCLPKSQHSSSRAVCTQALTRVGICTPYFLQSLKSLLHAHRVCHWKEKWVSCNDLSQLEMRISLSTKSLCRKCTFTPALWHSFMWVKVFLSWHE